MHYGPPKCPHFNLPYERHFLQIQLHYEELGVKISTYEFCKTQFSPYILLGMKPASYEQAGVWALWAQYFQPGTSHGIASTLRVRANWGKRASALLAALSWNRASVTQR